MPARTVVAFIAATLAACANVQERTPQLVEIRVQADNPAWAGPLECEASNYAGEWPFAAPGSVAVTVSSPLRITCQVPAGGAAQESTTRAVMAEAARRSAREGEMVGAVAGVPWASGRRTRLAVQRTSPIVLRVRSAAPWGERRPVEVSRPYGPKAR